MKAWAYLRVSSASQGARMQRADVARASKARGDTVVEWREEKRSGRTLDRPVLKELRAAAKLGKLPPRLYVWKLDRLTRSGFRDTLDVIAEFERHGVEVVSVADAFDLRALRSLPGPIGEMVVAFIAWGAELELRAHEDRRAAARERVIAAGGSWGRPRRMTAKQEARAAAMLKKGKTQREVSVALKIPRPTVGRFARRLKSPPTNGAARPLKKAGSRSDYPPAVQ